VIAADRIIIDGDEAWVVVAPDPKRGGISGQWLARPCNHCDGTEWLNVEDINCDCIDGRHTFDIEVEHPAGLYYGHIKRRAAVIEVLPIVRYSAEAKGGPYILSLAAPKMSGESHCLVRPNTAPGQSQLIRLPSAAAPGMYAVRLKIKETP
jgi:hypothetical protein